MRSSQTEKILNKRIKISSDVVSRNLEGEEVILNLETGLYFGLDSIGTEIWDHLKEGEKPSRIASLISESYQVEESKCAKDLLSFIKKLERKKLIKTSS